MRGSPDPGKDQGSGMKISPPRKVAGMNGGFDRYFSRLPARDSRTNEAKRAPRKLCAAFSEEIWEEYALGLRNEESSEVLEEHLLVCTDCQDVLAEVDEYIRVAKAAMALSTPGDDGGGLLFPDSQTHRRLSKPVKAAAAFAGNVLWLS